jgi:hypothetical protein
MCGRAMLLGFSLRLLFADRAFAARTQQVRAMNQDPIAGRTRFAQGDTVRTPLPHH